MSGALTSEMKFLGRICKMLIRRFGFPLRELDCDQILGRALVIPWRGRLYLIGYEGPPLVPVFVADSKVYYWRASIAFKVHPPPDFESLKS